MELFGEKTNVFFWFYETKQQNFYGHDEHLIRRGVPLLVLINKSKNFLIYSRVVSIDIICKVVSSEDVFILKIFPLISQFFHPFVFWYFGGFFFSELEFTSNIFRTDIRCT